uniref:Metalloendopeptidase n=1 Tax=Neogobius melanostomus TaxID=47308 RepID=A0A8C6WKI9_9GOBI
MPFWVVSLIVILWCPFDVKSDPIIKADSKGLYFDAQNASQSSEENPETIEELTSNQSIVDEGDIIPQIDRNAVQHIWKTHVIPYVIDDEISYRTQDILKATKMISDPTCLTFRQRKTEMDYLFFKNSEGCASYVGCIGGMQPVYMGSLCLVGNIVHEILHALGFFHEHTRLDRDKYIDVLTENIREGAQKNFVKQSGDTGNALMIFNPYCTMEASIFHPMVNPPSYLIIQHWKWARERG